MNRLNVVPHDHRITPSMREALNKQKALVIWFTGLSGSGKSTLADLLETALFDAGKHTYLLDGDTLRTGLNKDLDFSAAGRTENIRRVGEVAKMMADAGLIVLSSFVSPFEKDRELVRQTVGAHRFVQVYIDCPVEVCEARDVKGLYAKARNGVIPEFTGISSPFEVPLNPEIRVDTANQSIQAAYSSLVKQLEIYL